MNAPLSTAPTTGEQLTRRAPRRSRWDECLEARRAHVAALVPVVSRGSLRAAALYFSAVILAWRVLRRCEALDGEADARAVALDPTGNPDAATRAAARAMGIRASGWQAREAVDGGTAQLRAAGLACDDGAGAIVSCAMGGAPLDHSGEWGSLSPAEDARAARQALALVRAELRRRRGAR